MFCPRCGEKNPDGAKFCAACGAPFARPAAGSSPASTPAPVRRAPVAAIVASVAAVMVAGIAVFVVWLAFFSPWPIDEKNFPDPALRAAVAATADTNHDGQLSRDEGRATTSLSIDGAASLEGLGHYFPNLDALALHGGTLVSLKINDLPNLVSLYAESEPLQVLNVTETPKLRELHLPSSTQVIGLEFTELHESWVPTSVEERHDGGYTTTYAIERDAEGRVTARSVTSGDNMNEWSYVYDEQGRLVSEVNHYAMYGADNSVETTFGYDDEGRLVSVESPEGMSAAYYAYDDQGRVATMSMGDVGDPTSLTTYTYDEAGRLASRLYAYKSDRGMQATYSYDAAGRLVGSEETDQILGELYEAVAYERDAAGNVVRVTYTDPDHIGSDSYWSPVEYGYDEQGRMVSATAELDGSTYFASFAYDSHGNVSEVTEGVVDGMQSTFTPTYARFFVAEGGREPDSGITVGVDYRPLELAQRTSLVGVWATPRVTPDPSPVAQPGDSLVMFF